MAPPVVVTQAQQESLDDTDCYASIWEQILSRQREEDKPSSSTSSAKHGGGIWGGRGKGGRGLARRTFQPKDVVIDNVRLQYLGGEVCLDRATIKFLHNHVYALVGRNGCGKSTLLQRIHSQKIPGWSIQWSSVYIPPSLPLEYQDLSPLQVLKRFYEDSKRTSSTATESMISDVEGRLQSLDATEDREEIERLCEELSTLSDALDPDESCMDQSNEEYLRDLKIDPHRPCKELSRGQQKEVLLLLVTLCSFTNLILLDEPTNDLDIQGLFRLRQHIEGASTTIVMVSHDVDLINDVATDIIDMNGKQLSYYPGNYDSYRLMKEQQETHHLRKSLAMEKKREQLRNTLQNLKERPVPKRGGPRRKGKAIASHRKKIDRHEESIEELDSAIFVRERKGLTTVQRLKLAEVLKATPDKAVQFVLPKTTSQWGEPLIFADDVGYGSDKDAMANPQDTFTTADDDDVDVPSPITGKDCATGTEFVIEKRPGFLFDCVNMCIEEGSTNCILGPTTSTSALLRILAKRLDPIEGTVCHASGVRVGYIDSQAIAELVSEIDPYGKRTAMEYLMEEFPQKSEQELRGHLTAFGLSPASQTGTHISFLSGGETFRFVLAKVMVDDPPVLCLEHPTSNLDVESVQALAHGLRDWNGTLIMVCHDANFLRSMEDVQCVVIVPEEGKLRRILADEGMFGMDAYLKTMQFTTSTY